MREPDVAESASVKLNHFRGSEPSSRLKNRGIGAESVKGIEGPGLGFVKINKRSGVRLSEGDTGFFEDVIRRFPGFVYPFFREIS